MKNILIVRTDRLGDVLLTTPLGMALKNAIPGVCISWLVRPYTAPLLHHNPAADRILLDNSSSVWQLAGEIRRYAFDAAIIALPRWRTVFACWRAGIPTRVGPASKIYSVLLNQRIWQHRSRGTKHEADFNLELLSPFGISFQRYPTVLQLTDEERDTAKKDLISRRVNFEKPFVILHPGSGGSSARWPLSYFMQLGDLLQDEGCQVLVTSGPGENYQSVMIDQMRRIPIFVAAGSVTLRQLAGILSWADLFVSNSTGPLHMAVALKVPTVSIFSAMATCHPTRWGPYPDWPEKSGLHSVAVAPVEDNVVESMGKVDVRQVLELCHQRLEARRPTKGRPRLG